jgi:hypothetical protein
MTSLYGVRKLREPRVQAVVVGMLAVILLVVRGLEFVYLTTQPQWGYDLSFYWTAASHLLHGQPIYSQAQLSGPYAPQGQDGFLYPPPFAALVIPLVWLAPQGAQVAEWIWSAIGALIVVGVALALWRSERLGERYPLLRGNGRWLLVVGALTFPPVVGELSIGNVHLLLLGLFALAWLGIRRGSARDDWTAGVALGVAAVIKVFPGVLLLWLLLTRRFRAAVAMVVGVAAFALVTLPITGIEPWLQYPRVLANLSAVTDTTDTISPTIWLAPYLGFDVARWLVMGIGVLLLAWVALRDSRAGGDAMPARSFAVAVALSVLIAPNVFHHYLSILVLPFLLALGLGIRLRWLFLAYLLMSGGTQPGLGDYAWVVNRVLPTLGTLVLLGALVFDRVAAVDTAPVRRRQPA